MRKYISVLVGLLVCLMWFSACTADTDQAKGNTGTRQYTVKEDFEQYLEDRDIDGEVLYLTCDRFEADDKMQAFALVGTAGDCELLYTDGEEVISLLSNLKLSTAPTVVVTSTRPIYLLSSVDDDGQQSSCAYLVNDGRPTELEGAGESLNSMGNDDFFTLVSENDRNSVNGKSDGLSQKRYYLYFDGTKLIEYGDIIISESEFMKLNNSDKVLNGIKDCGYTVTEIIYRANGIININCERKTGDKTEYENLTVKVLKSNCICIPSGQAQESDYVGRSTYGGSYKTAAFPEIATYPERFEVE